MSQEFNEKKQNWTYKPKETHLVLMITWFILAFKVDKIKTSKELSLTQDFFH